MQVSTRAVATAALAALVAVAGYVSDPTVLDVPYAQYALPAVVALLTLAFAFGWPVLAQLPSRLGTSVVIALCGVGAVAMVQRTVDEPYLRGLPIVFAFSVLLAFVNELARRGGRERLVESVTGTVAGTLIAVTGAGWVATQHTPGGASLLVAGALALAAGSAASALPFHGWTGAGVTTGAAAAAGAVGGLVLPSIDPVAGALLGVGVGVLVSSLQELFDRLPALSRRPAAVAALVVPVPVTGILVYVVGRVLVG
ncbi:hypothetical protein ACWFNE_21140 [Cellulomonas sp. NPDC055163]